MNADDIPLVSGARLSGQERLLMEAILAGHHQRDRIADFIWSCDPDPPQTADNCVRVICSKLRKKLAPEYVLMHTHGFGYHLVGPGLETEALKSHHEALSSRLSRQRQRIFDTLARGPGGWASVETLLQNMYDYRVPDGISPVNVLHTQICNLRCALMPGWRIRNTYRGYRLCPPSDKLQ